MVERNVNSIVVVFTFWQAYILFQISSGPPDWKSSINSTPLTEVYLVLKSYR